MGKRISIQVLDLLQAGAMICQKIVHHPTTFCSDHPPVEAWTETLLVVQFPGDSHQFHFDFEVSEAAMNATHDYNEWGLTYKALALILERLAIPREVY